MSSQSVGSLMPTVIGGPDHGHHPHSPAPPPTAAAVAAAATVVSNQANIYCEDRSRSPHMGKSASQK